MTAYVCLACRAYRRPVRELRGSGALELILWLMFIVPGLVYAVWRSRVSRPTCSVCGAALLSEDAPEVQALMASSPAGLARTMTVAQRLRIASSILPPAGGVGMAAVLVLHILVPTVARSKVVTGAALLCGLLVLMHPVWHGLHFYAAERDRRGRR